MILFVTACTLILLAIAEHYSRRKDLRCLSVEFDIDSTLTEPDEIVTLRYTVRNTGRLPALSAGLTLMFNEEIRICEEESWLRRHARRSFLGTRIDRRFYLMPRQKLSGRLRVSCGRRGVFELGRYCLECGDLMGLHPLIITGDTGLRIVCTARRSEPTRPDTRGGILGEIPVRRFILDDPCMLRGYREYTGREPMKQISWMQTAKTGQLTVRQNDFIVDRNVSILFNMEAAPAAAQERCLELLRSVCEELEERCVPYGLFTNGDLFSLNEGLGKNRVFHIQRRIGMSRFVAFFSFSRLVDEYAFRPRENSSCIVITPCFSPGVAAALPRLSRCTGREPLLLCGEEAGQ